MILPLNAAHLHTHNDSLESGETIGNGCGSANSVRTGVRLQLDKTLNEEYCYAFIDEPLFAPPVTKPTFSHQAQQSTTLQRFVVSPELTSKTSSVPAGIQLTKSAEDECTCSSVTVSTVQPKSNEVPHQVKVR